MKKSTIFRLSLLVAVCGLFILQSCKKEKGANNTDEYYIKYEVNSTTTYGGSIGKLDVTLNSETNTPMTITINQRTLSETVIGPAKKGFNATLKVNAIGKTYDVLKLYTNIYVSKNGSPFALKKIDGSDIPRDNVSVSYVIDY
jgi:hypothetical protein